MCFPITLRVRVIADEDTSFPPLIEHVLQSWDVPTVRFIFTIVSTRQNKYHKETR